MALQFTRGFLYRADFTEAELLALRADVKAQLIASGPESIMSWGDNGTNVSKRVEMTVAEWMDEISYSLALLDPDTYGTKQRTDVSVAAFPNRFQ